MFVGVGSMIRFNVACLLGDWQRQNTFDLGRMLIVVPVFTFDLGRMLIVVPVFTMIDQRCESS
jgi:hypothetical protein